MHLKLGLVSNIARSFVVHIVLAFLFAKIINYVQYFFIIRDYFSFIPHKNSCYPTRNAVVDIVLDKSDMSSNFFYAKNAFNITFCCNYLKHRCLSEVILNDLISPYITLYHQVKQVVLLSKKPSFLI